MRPEIVLRHEFVRAIPEQLEERTIYVSIEFATVAHKCCCGCGSEIVTPLTPTDWKLTFDGETVTLHPSVGNWNLPCRSHYWIREDRAQWAPAWSREEIEAERAADARAKADYYGQEHPTHEPQRAPPAPVPTAAPPTGAPPREGFWRRLRKRLFGS